MVKLATFNTALKSFHFKKWKRKNLSFLDDLKKQYKYDGGDKRMSVLGFVKQEDIQRQYLLGDGCMVFQPVEGDEVLC